MQQLERVLEMKEVKKGKYYVERQVLPVETNKLAGPTEKIVAFILGQCNGCGTEFAGDIDLSQEVKEMPCSNKECNYKFLYKDNTLIAI